MENSFNNRDFEKFVQQNADQYRMFPTEKVWKGIHNALHTRRRWYGIGLALLILTTASVTTVMLMQDSQPVAATGSNGKIQSITPSIAKGTIPDVAIVSPVDQSVNGTTEKTYPTNLQDRFITTVNHEPANTDLGVVITNSEQTKITPEISQPEVPVKSISTTDKQIINDPVTAIKLPEPVITSRNDINPAVTANKSNATVATDEKPSQPDILRAPYTIESVVNAYKHPSRSKKLSWQVYLTPTVSYRTLSENTEFISQARYNNIISGGGGGVNPVYYSTDVNSVVNHRPDVGFKVGVTTSYPLSNYLNLTGGLQLGVSKYDIKAYDHSTETATIALSSAMNGRTSISTATNYRNGNGFRENWLRNFYFSASLPVGLELKLSDGTKNYFGVATTLQPTYVLDNRAYLISTDYKNYAEIPSLTRRWNLNTSFEIFSVFTTGKVQWKVGPQVNYQVMSSFIKNYPIKEHLFDFGLKLGVILK
jgi:hypothetical protein